MPVSTADAILAAASCNTLLAALERLETLVSEISEPRMLGGFGVRIDAMKSWIGDARNTVLDIKARM